MIIMKNKRYKLITKIYKMYIPTNSNILPLKIKKIIVTTLNNNIIKIANIMKKLI